MRRQTNALWQAAQAFVARMRQPEVISADPGIGLALGGGFARGMAHIGVLRVLERNKIPVRFLAGVSAGSIVASAYAAGADSHELEGIARSLKFKHVAGWGLSRLGLVQTNRMGDFLKRALKVHRFEEMRIPLAVVATDVCTGEPAIFHGKGEIFGPVRASCSYPGLFQPVRHDGRVLVDGAISMEIPAQALKQLGVTRVLSVALPAAPVSAEPGSMFAVVNRCFQIMQRRTEQHWRQYSDVVVAPQVHGVAWDDFTQLNQLIEAGERAAEQVLPLLQPAACGAPALKPMQSAC